MAGHSYGDMWINGGEVHNGDRISIVKNDIKTAFRKTTSAIDSVYTKILTAFP